MQNFEQTVALNADVMREINKKCEKQIEDMRAREAQHTAQKATKIKDAAPDALFSDETFWQVINLKTLMEFEISGTTAAFYLTGKGAIKKMLENGEIDAFEHKDFYVKFKCTNVKTQKSAQSAKPKNTSENKNV